MVVNKNIPGYETMTLGSGCFWCTEAIFKLVKGVINAVPGYSGDDKPDPTYELICSGETDYAEVVQITYDPVIISFKELLEIYWKTHDPTTINRQGADVGPQYRSVIFYHTEKQKEEAEFYMEELDKAGIWNKPIVTEISPFINFYQAEAYHTNFYKNNPANAYCNFVITPKVEKFKNVFSDHLIK
jgi:peptide-methionine (S)-S-oxide reductase